MSKKQFCMMLLLAASVAGAQAQNAIAIHQKDGKVAKFSFSDKPVVTYSGSELILTTTQTMVQYPLYLLQKIAFDVDISLTGIKDEPKADAQFSFLGGTLSILGGDPGSMVYVYHLNGIKAGQYVLDREGNASISLQPLRKDIYIVKTNRFTFKFKK